MGAFFFKNIIIKNHVSPDSHIFGESQIKLVSIAVHNSLSLTIYHTREDYCYICARFLHQLKQLYCPRKKCNEKNNNNK